MVRKKVCFIIAGLMLIATATFPNRTYYLDSEKGNDNNYGTSETQAWKSFSKINRTLFKPGDCILLKRNLMFEGSLHPNGSGNRDSLLRISAYGVGRRPVINAEGHEFAIKLIDANYWEISDIETTGGEKAGIFIGCTKNNLVLDHIAVNNCYVHHIGDTAKPDWAYSTTTGGIIVVNGTFDEEGKPVFFNSVINDVRIHDCMVRYNLRWTCISISSGKLNDTRGNANIISNCIAEFSAADGIRMNGVQNSRIEFCTMFRNGAWPKSEGDNLGGLGAWFFDALNCTIQYCEASYVGANETDGGAFDIDYLQKNSTVQYCYGHHCAGYGVSVFGADPQFPTENSVIRYNVFAHNGQDTSFAFQGDFFVFTWNGGLLDGVNIHNNISCWNPASTGPVLNFNADFTGNRSNSFTGNRIFSKQSWLVFCKNDSLRSDSNSFRLLNTNTVEPEKPVWDLRKQKYSSLNDWQKASRQDVHSSYGETGYKDFGFIGGETVRQKVDPKVILNLDKMESGLVLVTYMGPYNSSWNNGVDTVLAQLAYIRSMKRQYEERRLKVFVILESSPENNLISDEVANFINDHELTGIVINNDNSMKPAKNPGPDIYPSTILISEDGYLIRKWQSIVLPAQLAFAIESEIDKHSSFTNHPSQDQLPSWPWKNLRRHEHYLTRSVACRMSFSRSVYVQPGG